ncbi:flavonol 4'-sulfotransferase [Striga asiatica]|uniref:Sulfotransferase n=1 Tax=Striga asiatica TaxID=4170 RepID=A0A5A7R111_STRAF|nr:flavonol 4'-sulfotransferase [Striga asiatica]
MSNSNPSSPSPNDDDEPLHDLPKARFWDAVDLSQWEGYWFRLSLMKPAIFFRSNFQARDDDILLASTMKTGTTWLKALSLCILHKNTHDHLLSLENPHFHVPTIEAMTYATKNLPVDVYDTSTPHLLHTHLPYAVLPDSVKNSACKIVYIARNPKDTLISMWHFFNKVYRPNENPFPLEEALDGFCNGIHLYGPYFDHVAEYWVESRRRPGKVMFVKYEELKSDPNGRVAEIAEFLGRPFVDGREIDEVLWSCSLERLKGLEVNKGGSLFSNIPNSGGSIFNVPNSLFFRKGEVGDWKTYLTPEMEHQIDQVSREKFEPLGLFF